MTIQLHVVRTFLDAIRAECDRSGGVFVMRGTRSCVICVRAAMLVSAMVSAPADDRSHVTKFKSLCSCIYNFCSAYDSLPPALQNQLWNEFRSSQGPCTADNVLLELGACVLVTGFVIIGGCGDLGGDRCVIWCRWGRDSPGV